MHMSASTNAYEFFMGYVNKEDPITVIEVGVGVSTAIRDMCPPNAKFLGMDIAGGVNPDIVLTDPYKFPLESNSVDVMISSSCFEHTEFFWLTFNEIMRVLKPNGLFYLNAPSSGQFHRHPGDCYRFYPDAGTALVNWAIKSGHTEAALIESYLCHYDIIWHDFVAVFVKDKKYIENYPNRIWKKVVSGCVSNVLEYGSREFQHVDYALEKRKG